MGTTALDGAPRAMLARAASTANLAEDIMNTEGKKGSDDDTLNQNLLMW
jgi:hypothetical protein